MVCERRSSPLGLYSMSAIQCWRQTSIKMTASIYVYSRRCADTQPVIFQLRSLDHAALETTAAARHRP